MYRIVMSAIMVTGFLLWSCGTDEEQPAEEETDHKVEHILKMRSPTHEDTPIPADAPFSLAVTIVKANASSGETPKADVQIEGIEVKLELLHVEDGVNLGGAKTAKTDAKGKAVFNNLTIDTYGSSAVTATATVAGEEISGRYWVDMGPVQHPVIITPILDGGLTVGEAFSIKIQHNGYGANKVSIEVVDTEENILRRWNNNTSLIDYIQHDKNSVTFKDLFFTAEVASPELLVTITIDEELEWEVKTHVPLPAVKATSATATVAGITSTEEHPFGEVKIALSNLKGDTACDGDCRVDAFLTSDLSCKAVSEIDNNGEVILSIPDDCPCDTSDVLVRLTQAKKDWYFLAATEKQCVISS